MRLSRSCYLTRPEQGRRFPPRTVGLWFEEGTIHDFREATAAEAKSRSHVEFTTSGFVVFPIPLVVLCGNGG